MRKHLLDSIPLLMGLGFIVCWPWLMEILFGTLPPEAMVMVNKVQVLMVFIAVPACWLHRKVQQRDERQNKFRDIGF